MSVSTLRPSARYESNLIDRQELDALLDEFQAESARQGGSDGGGDYYKTLIARNSRPVTAGVVDAIGRDRVLIRDAASLLDAKPGQLRRIAQELQGAG